MADADRKPSRFGVRRGLAARRPANPITLCDGHGVDFVTVTGQILMAVHTRNLGSRFPGENDS
jgi:hypothetical protein